MTPNTFTMTPTNRTNDRRNKEIKCFTYQTNDGCLILHEESDYGSEEDEVNKTEFDNIENESQKCDEKYYLSTKQSSGNNGELEWKDIKTLNISSLKIKDPNSGECYFDSKKKVLCWRADDDACSSSGSSSDTEEGGGEEET